MSSRTRTPVLRTTPTILRFSTFSISESRNLKKGEHVCSLKILKAHGAWFPPWLTTHASYGTCNNSLEGAWTTNTRCPTSKDECEKKLKVRFLFCQEGYSYISKKMQYY